MNIFLTVIILGILIFVHELGHFLTARRIGIPVYEFALGFGYKLFSHTKDGVQYSLRLIPLGGFVRMAGEEPGDNEDPLGYSHRTPLEKIMVSVAGPLMNILLGLLIFVYSYAFIGLPQASNEPVIGRVISGEPAAEAGVQAGDRVVAINAYRIESWEQITSRLGSNPPGQAVTITIERQGKTLDLVMVPRQNATTGVPAIGVMGQFYYEKQGVLKSISYGFKQTFMLTGLLLSGLWTIISGGASAGDLAGPVGITMMVGEASQFGTIFLLGFIAFLSINLGVLNLLPIPALDGSRIIFALAEVIRRKPLEPEREGLIHWFGFLFLMLLIVFVTYNDILRLIKG
ncbi:MAG: RIP metalloprotease RseP [Syntrophomonadaceae bacterium]|jgi:regulator of sigma E protease